MEPSKTGAVLVAGGGIAGIQAALDLAGTGFYVYLVDKKPAIGGTMPVLDKTFPTNDCSMCILSPKLVECGRHLNIDVITGAEVIDIQGGPGNFNVTLNQKARMVDPEKCTGCGSCAEECPVKVEDEFNQGLNTRKAIYKLYAQAYPNAYAIDPEHCIECGSCEEVCPAGAIDREAGNQNLNLAAGAVILCPGSEQYDAGLLEYYGYGQNPNVLTSLEFERILSASGPFGGHLQRPADGSEPRKIAWIQCVGSRNCRIERDYCSSVCCMYAIKEAVIAKEHSKNSIDTAIFFMDARTFGKDFEKYYNRAQNEHGVRFVRSRVFALDYTGPGNGQVRIRYAGENGEPTEEDFDLAVLSTGLEPPREMVNLAHKLGIRLNRHNFCEPAAFTGAATNKPGIYVAGTFSGPRDIPETVMQTGAAAGSAGTLLAESRNTMTREEEMPPERDITGEEPRVGVFVCHCGINIGSVVDVPAVAEHVQKLPEVVHAQDCLFACSQDMQQAIKEVIDQNQLNRVVVASCSPRTHEPVFRHTLREAGLNPYLFEMTNIREQCSWVHSGSSELATAKAKKLAERAVARVARQNPLYDTELPVEKSALVIGGGVAGMNSALDLARQGIKVYLVEKSRELGGLARRIHHTAGGHDVQSYLHGLAAEVRGHPAITIYTSSTVRDVTGSAGNFHTKINRDGSDTLEIRHGAAIIAIGGEEHSPEEYLYGTDPRVMTGLELEASIARHDELVQKACTVVMIQCVGSRQEDRPYCSRVCCTESIKNALRLKEINPGINVYVLYRDMRTYGFTEELYTKARKQGIIFIRYSKDDKPVVEQTPDNSINVTARDHVLGEPVTLEADILSLAAAITPARDSGRLARTFKVPRNDDGFFLEAHMKLRPVDFTSEGIYLCGLAHAPKTIEESIAQGKAAAARAMTLLSRDCLLAGGAVSEIDPEKCSGCRVCVEICPYTAISLNENNQTAEISQALCKGCGTCAAACPTGACSARNFTDEIILREIETLCSS